MLSETFGHPQPVEVSLTVEKGPFILITGHDLYDLKLLLEQTEGKGVCILLTLLHLGIKNIKLRPTLPAFLSPNVSNFLIENFNIAPVTTPKKDLKAIQEGC